MKIFILGIIFSLISISGFSQSSNYIVCPSGIRTTDEANRISSSPEKLDRNDFETISEDSLKTEKNTDSTKLVISFPETNAIYTGYWNIMHLGFRDKKLNQFRLECEGCDTLFQSSENDSSNWIIGASNTDKVIVRAYSEKDKLISETIIPVHELPAPTVFLDKNDAQTILTAVPQKINLNYHESIPLSVRFLIVKWNININGNQFSGPGSNLSAEAQDFISSQKKGTIIVNLTYAGPTGQFPIKEILEFDID